MTRWLSLGSWLLLGLGLVSCGSEAPEIGGEAPEILDTPGPRVVVIAVDGLEPTLVDRLLAQGRLPHLRDLIEGGLQTTIECVVGSSSPVVWTTVATGVEPQRHGITDFTVDGLPVTSTLRRVPAIWNILPRHGVDAATLGWLVTWPAEPEAGIVVSERAYWGKFEHKVEPPGILDLPTYHYSGRPDLSFLQEFTDYPYDPERVDVAPADLAADDPRRQDPSYAIHFLLRRRLIDIHVRDTTYLRIAQDVLAKEPDLDALLVYFQGADYVGHGFWKYYDPEPFREVGQEVPTEDVERLGQIIPRYYDFLDRQIGELLQDVPEDALVMVLSDHGFGPGLGEYTTGGDFLSGNHRPHGVLILSGPQVRVGKEPEKTITHFDILPTLLYALDVPLARDQPGRPLLRLFRDQHRRQHDITLVDSHGPADGPQDGDPGTASEHDDEILQELRSLGYIQ